MAAGTPGRFELDAANALGAGGYGKVVTAKNKETGKKVAAKVISTSRMKMSAIQKEIDLMGKLNHPNIIGLQGFETMGKNIVIYMELANGGELFGRVISVGSLQEDEARPYFKQLMLAVQFMHQQGVVHRDLKLENVLLNDDQCKVCDFGLAHVYETDPAQSGVFLPATLREVCGSKSYCAPEVLEGRGYQGYPTDVWSCGICLFAMLAGFFPLDEAAGADWRFERIRMAANAGASVTHTIFGFYDRPCTLSREVTDLIDGMLVVPPAHRLTVDAVLASPWANGTKIAGGGAAGNVYRGMAPGQFADPDALRAMLAEESDEMRAPVYRGGAAEGPPPMLRKQDAMFCAEFMLEE